MQKKWIDESDQWAFEIFAARHPREAYEMDPDRFWAYFEPQFPGVPREILIELLENCEEENDREKTD